MDIEVVLKKVEEVASPVLEAMGFELIERQLVNEHGHRTLRLYIDHDDRQVTIDDCADVSRALEGPLDVADVVPGSYHLEISSPGIERPLRRAKDFERFAGETIQVRTKRPLHNQKNFVGVLQGIENGQILLQNENGVSKIPLEELRKAHIKA